MGCLTASTAVAHVGTPLAQVPAAPDPTVRVEKVAENTWCLFGKGGNVGVVVTPGAVLAVDTQYEDIAPALLAEISKLSPAPLKYVVNTHFHGDHTGGNRIFAAQADLIGHENVRRRLYEGQGEWVRSLPGRILFTESLLGGANALGEKARGSVQGALDFLKRRLEEAKRFDAATVVAPSVLYQDRLRVYLGDEEVEIFHLAPGHTDGDSVVYLPRRGVVHMGDLFWNGGFPFIDVDGGGSSEGWIRTLDTVLARVPPETRVIAGHGPVGGPAELRSFRSYLADLHEAVAAARKKGQTLSTALEEIRLESHADLTPGFQSLQSNILQVWEELDSRDASR